MKKTQLTLIALLIAISASAKGFYVSTTGGETATGNSWSLANSNLQKMINNASTGDTIYVATGVYYGGFVMREGITVRGGYVLTTNEKSEIVATRILPGNAANDSERSILDGTNTQRTLTQIIDFSTPTTWDGFLIRNGTSATDNVAVGSLIYAENGTDVAGIVYKLDGDNGKMLSIAEAKVPWGGYQVGFAELPYRGAPNNDMNGTENTEAIVDKLGEANPDFKNNYTPNGNYAARWCSELSTFTGWHLPTAGEWQEVYAAKSSLNSMLIAANTRLANGYWTSSHAGELPAWVFYFENGKSTPTLKYIEKNVRAVCSFQKSGLPTSPVEGSVLLRNNGVLSLCIVDGQDVATRNNISSNSDLQIFPNPARCGETITISTAGSGMLQMLDMSGKVTLSASIQNTTAGTQITAPETAGIYLLRINNRTSKMVIY